MKPSLILRTGAKFLVVLMLLFSISALLRGHNAPGGGFVGGLLAASAFALYMLAFDSRAARRLLHFDPRNLMTTGLIVALAGGAAALFAGRPFLTGLWYAKPVPGIGKISTVLAFDIGVYLAVAGTALLIVFALAEEEN
ncbi:MAG: Na+/H+ antiporter subunit B [Acidobacteriota bacterium]|nr:Na+/H+ antiporter subunit B [Acidobacteriota bacterium]